MKSFVAKDGSSAPPSPGRNGERHFHGEQRSNETHSSTTDSEAKLAKKGKGKEAKLAYTGSVMTENRNGFVVEAELRQMSGTVERETAKDMIVRYSPGAKRITPGADSSFTKRRHHLCRPHYHCHREGRCAASAFWPGCASTTTSAPGSGRFCGGAGYVVGRCSVAGPFRRQTAPGCEPTGAA
jgi:hypothetical protein